MKRVNIYIATSNRSPKPQDGIGIYILEAITSKGPATVTKEIAIKEATANQAQLQILADAMERIKEPCEICIYAENGYLAAVENLTEWKKNDWKTTRGKEVANKELWMKIEEKSCVLQSNIQTKHEYKGWLEGEIRRRLENG